MTPFLREELLFFPDNGYFILLLPLLATNAQFVAPVAGRENFWINEIFWTAGQQNCGESGNMNQRYSLGTLSLREHQNEYTEEYAYGKLVLKFPRFLYPNKAFLKVCNKVSHNVEILSNWKCFIGRVFGGDLF